MSHLKIIASGGASGRRILAEELEAMKMKGREHAGTREGGEWREIIAAGRAMGLFASRRVTVVESAELLGPFPAELVEHLEDEDAPEAVLLVYEKDPGKAFPPEARKKIAMLKAESVPFWSSQRKKWLLGLAAKQGISLADEAAALLVELTEDPEEVRAELASLGIYADGARVDADMVRRLSYDEGRNLVLKFLDSFCQARAAEVLAVFERLKGEPSVLPLLTALYNRIRPAVYLGVFPQAEAERVMVALEVKDYALKMAREALRNYRPEALSDMALGLLSLSWGEKTSYAEGWPGFEALVMRCMAGAGAKK